MEAKGFSTRRCFLLALIFTLITKTAPVTFADDSSATAVVHDIERSIDQVGETSLRKGDAAEKIAQNLRKRGFAEEQLLDGASYIARRWDIFAPGPYVYGFHGISQALWSSVWKPKLGSDENIMKERVVPIIRDSRYPPRMRLFYLQIVDSYLRNLKNAKQPVPDDLSKRLVETAYSIGEAEDPNLSAYTVRVVAAWDKGTKRDQFLAAALASPKPGVQDSAADAVAFWGASEHTRKEVLALIEKLEALPVARQRNLLRAASRIATDRRISIGERKNAIQKLSSVYEATGSLSVKDQMQTAFLRIGAGLPSEEKEAFVWKLKEIRDRAKDETKSKLDKTLSDISIVEENEKKHNKKH